MTCTGLVAVIFAGTGMREPVTTISSMTGAPEVSAVLSDAVAASAARTGELIIHSAHRPPIIDFTSVGTELFFACRMQRPLLPDDVCMMVSLIRSKRPELAPRPADRKPEHFHGVLDVARRRALYD